MLGTEITQRGPTSGALVGSGHCGLEK